MEEYVLKLKGVDIFISDGSGKMVFDKNKAIIFKSIKQAKSWFKIIKESVPQLGKFKDWKCIKK